MTKTFTPDDLLRYLYEDTSSEETKEIEKALQNDISLQAEFEQLQSDMGLLNEVSYEPSERCISHIMDYARAMNLAALCN